MRRDGPSGTLSLVELYAPIAGELAESQRRLADELLSDQGFISDLGRHVRQFGGKQLRPALVLLAGRAGGELRPEHPTLAAVVELVHLATLVHDDVLDEADIRRRAATVNRLWGNERAVLLGDYLYSHAFALCSSLDTPLATRLIGQTAVTVCEGEMMQVARRGDLDLTEADYLDIIRRKTAALVETCCHLGGLYAGAAGEAVTRLRAYGRGLGMAFQIIDDLLDLIGDEAEVGKSLGRDVDEGELTLPVIHFLRSAGPAGRTALLAALRTPDATRPRRVAALLRDSDSIAYAQGVAAEHVAAGRRALLDLPPSPARESLSAMADFVLARRQ